MPSDELNRDSLFPSTLSEQQADGQWRGFTFFGGRKVCDSGQDSAPNLCPGTASLDLASARVGDRLRVVALHCGEVNVRLNRMGLVTGAVFQVVSCTAKGSVIIDFQGQQMGLGADMARCIQVSPVAPSNLV
jgi:Fe2+ transport system protein FeoA